MELKDAISIAVSTFAFIAAAVATFYARNAILHQRNAQGSSTNEVLLAGTYQMFIDHPELLHLYGISSQDLLSDGVSLAEFRYVLLNFLAGRSYYSVYGLKKISELSEARRAFLRNNKVRLIWMKYLRNQFFSIGGPSGSFGAAVDAYVKEIEVQATHGASVPDHIAIESTHGRGPVSPAT